MSQPPRVTLHQSPLRLMLILMLSVFTIEFGIMALFLAIPSLELHGWVEAAVDSSILSALLFPALFLTVLRPMQHHIKERAQAEGDLRAARDLLELRVGERTAELERRNREISVLAEMSDFLQACATMDEAYHIITRTVQQMFPASKGALFIFSASRNDLEMAAHWGEMIQNASERVFAPDECWALRRGRVYLIKDAQAGLICRHVAHPLPGQYLCVPMMGQGEVLGVLHLRCDPPAANDGGALLDERPAVTLSEHMTPALMNLKLRETLRHQSIRDPLTGLFNRRYMEETLERELRRAERRQNPLGVVMLDLDHFKQFNDSYGHDAGDLLLRELGALLNAHIRTADIACRYGGEEFTLILPEMPLEIVRQRVEALRLGVKQLDVRHRNQTLGVVTISAGIAMFPEHGTDGEVLLHVADRVLYRAKAEGRDRVVVFDASTAAA